MLYIKAEKMYTKPRLFGSCCRAAARPACRQHVLLHQLGVQLLLKRSGFGTGRDRWCIRDVRRVSSPCTLVRLASSSWGSQHSRHSRSILRGRCCGSRRRLGQRGPQTCSMVALHRHTSVTSCFKSSSEMSWCARSESRRGRRRRQCTRGQLVLGEEGAMVSDISGRQTRIGRRSNLLYSCCRIRCIENCCIRPKIAV